MRYIHKTTPILIPLSQFDIYDFQQFFKTVIEDRTQRKFDTMQEAYDTFRSTEEVKKIWIWKEISFRSKLNQKDIYKFFRFTWSRQFHPQINQHKSAIQQFVEKTLTDLKIKNKDSKTFATVWNKVWSNFGYLNLHYDECDQFVRYTTNKYFKKLNVNNEILLVNQQQTAENADLCNPTQNHTSTQAYPIIAFTNENASVGEGVCSGELNFQFNNEQMMEFQ